MTARAPGRGPGHPDPDVGAAPHIAHVTMPLATDSSSIAHVVRALTREHARAGGQSTVVVSHNRDAHFPEADVVTVDYTRVCPRQYFTEREYLLDAAAGAVLLERPHGARIFAPAAEALAPLAPDWVVLHEGQYAVTALPRLRRALPRTSIALHVHNAVSRSVLRPELSWLLRHADLVIGVSDVICAAVARRAWAPRGKIRTVYNGVDTSDFAPGEPRPAGDGATRLLFVGQVAPHKGAHMLLEGLAALGPAAARFDLRIVGSSVHHEGANLSDYERDLRRLASRTAARVEFRPFTARSALGEEYRWADAVCVPSEVEAFGLVAVEAMACGAFVLANRVGALPEVLGGTGALIEPSADGWAAALTAFTRAEALAGREASLARAAQFTWSRSYAALRAHLAEAGRARDRRAG